MRDRDILGMAFQELVHGLLLCVVARLGEVRRAMREVRWSFVRRRGRRTGRWRIVRLLGVLRRELRRLGIPPRGLRVRMRRLGPVLAIRIREGEPFCMVSQYVLRALRGPLPSIVEVCRGTMLKFVRRNVGVGKLSVLRVPAPTPDGLRAGRDEEPTTHHRKYGVQEKHGEGD